MVTLRFIKKDSSFDLANRPEVRISANPSLSGKEIILAADRYKDSPHNKVPSEDNNLFITAAALFKVKIQEGGVIRFSHKEPQDLTAAFVQVLYFHNRESTAQARCITPSS